MSSEDVEVVRRVYEAAARRDRDAVLALYDPDVELDAGALTLLDGDVFRGHEGLRAFFANWHQVWGEIHYDYDELIDAGEHVVSIVTRHARGRISGAEVERPFALVWTVRAGKVARVEWHLSREEALAAAGQRE